ncbi:MAG: hypothetical protein IPG79_02185 [Saprospiraceae bacterium]|nr:hypothetical protein [Saprospiraceae bacterium]
MRPGNSKIVHHALFFQMFQVRQNNMTIKHRNTGFSANENPDFDVFEVINRDQYQDMFPDKTQKIS